MNIEYFLIITSRAVTFIILSVLLYKQIKNVYDRRAHLNGYQATRLTLIFLTLSLWLERGYRLTGNFIDISKITNGGLQGYLTDTQWTLAIIQVFALYATYRFYMLVKDSHEPDDYKEGHKHNDKIIR